MVENSISMNDNTENTILMNNSTVYLQKFLLPTVASTSYQIVQY